MIPFVNKGTDEAVLKSLPIENISEELVKAMNKQGLVQKEVQYKTKNGKMATRKQWVRAGEEHKTQGKSKSQSPQKTLKNKSPHNSSKHTDSEVLFFPVADCGKDTTRAMSYSDVVTYYEKHKNKIKGSLKSFIQKNYFVSDGSTQTKDFYDTSHGYTKERQKLHDRIVQGIVDSANSPEKGKKPLAILMGGGSASGKGTLRDVLVLPRLQSAGINVGISDCDEIKEKLPEYKLFQEQDITSAAYRTHEESMDIAKEAFDALIKNNKNLLFDGTMKNYTTCMNMIDKLHKAGYEIQIVGADVPLETAINRSNKRAKDTGRQVPEGIITGAHGGFSLTYPKLLDEVDSYSLYDNSGDYPVLIQDNSGIQRPDLYEAFVQKGQDYIITKEIKRISKDYRVPVDTIKDLYDNGATLEEIREYYDLGLEV